MTTLLDWQAERDIALETVERNAGKILRPGYITQNHHGTMGR
jgi:hypothetical protein